MIRIAIVLVLLGGIASADAVSEKEAPVAGEDEALYSCRTKTGMVAVTFKPETELKDLVTWVMGFTCKNFIFDPRIVSTGRKVTVIAPNRMSATEAYRVFLVGLKTIGLTVVPKGDVVMIVESPAAKKETVPILKKGAPENTDQIVRIVIKPAFAPVETLSKAFATIKSDAGDIQAIGNILLVTDYGSHVRDMMSIASLIDVPNGTDGIYTIPIAHADAAKLGEKIGQILGISTGSGPPARAPAADAMKDPTPVPSKLLIDERTNTLIVAASEPAYQRVKALVERLDIALDIEGGTSIHVYQLGNAIAEELALVLTTAIGGASQQKGAATPGANNTTATKSLAPIVQPSVADNLGAMLEGQVRVIADKSTNKVIVMSSGRDYLAIKDVIRELDQPRRQVFIEAVILEVTVGNDTQIGTSSHGGVSTGNGSALVLGGVQTGQVSTFALAQGATSTSSDGTTTSSSASNLASLTGLVTGVVGSPLSAATSILGTSIPSYAVLFQALATQSNTKVMSTPSIIALDNEEAKYQVGTNIAYSSGTTGSATGFVSNNVSRQPLVLELDIKPHISANDSVLLEVKHSAQDLQGSNSLGPIWSTRSFETRVLVHDQDTIVLGGLMQEREELTVTKVPLLGDIPLLGYFFKFSKKVKTKTNLLVMLTPYIIKDTLDLQAIRERKQREHDEFASAFDSLEGMHYQPNVDYGRKRGVVEEINRMVLAVEDDRAALREVAAPKRVEAGPVR